MTKLETRQVKDELPDRSIIDLIKYYFALFFGGGGWWGTYSATCLVSNTMTQRTANESAPGLCRICKRSDQPKIEKLENHNERLILHRKLKKR